MRRLSSRRLTALVVVAAMAALLVVTVAGPAGASTVDVKRPKLCTAIANVGKDLNGLSPDSDQKVAAADAKAFKKAAKSASGKVKSALNQMASFFAGVGDAGSKTDAIKYAASHALEYSKAASTFLKYYTKNCVSLPSIPTT
jgi:hypothetical protein